MRRGPVSFNSQDQIYVWSIVHILKKFISSFKKLQKDQDKDRDDVLLSKMYITNTKKREVQNCNCPFPL